MSAHGFTLRRFCREVAVDPSFFYKVLSGKRSPPAEESVLRRIAVVLELDAADLIVSAGRIPSEWHALWKDPALFQDMHSLATGTVRARMTPKIIPDRRQHGGAAAPPRTFVKVELSEELL